MNANKDNELGGKGPRIHHTPGPWSYYHRRDGHGNFHVGPDDRNSPPVAVTLHQSKLALERCNARLIAAAPDLLAAAELVIRNWSEGNLAEAVRQLDAAVASAR